MQRIHTHTHTKETVKIVRIPANRLVFHQKLSNKKQNTKNLNCFPSKFPIFIEIR